MFIVVSLTRTIDSVIDLCQIGIPPPPTPTPNPLKKKKFGGSEKQNKKGQRTFVFLFLFRKNRGHVSKSVHLSMSSLTSFYRTIRQYFPIALCHNSISNVVFCFSGRVGAGFGSVAGPRRSRATHSRTRRAHRLPPSETQPW